MSLWFTRSGGLGRRLGLLACVALVGFAAQGLTAEDQLVERTVCVFDFIDLSADAERVAGIGAMLRQSMEMELANRGFQISPLAKMQETAQAMGVPIDGMALLDKALATRIAANAGADVLVSGFFTIEGDYVGIGVLVYDLVTRRVAVAETTGGKAGVELYDTVDALGPAIAGPMREALQPLPASQITVEREQVTIKTEVVERIESIGTKVALSITSPDEGAMVSIAGQEVGRIQKGSFTTELTSGSSVEVRVALPGYYPYVRLINVKTKPVKLKLPLLIRRPWGEFGLQYVANTPMGIGAAARAYIIPDFLYGPVFVAGHLIPQSYVLGDPLAVQSWEIEAGTGLGMYLFMPAKWPVRAWIEARLFGNLSFYGQTPMTALFGGYDLGWGVEYNGPRSLFYLANRYRFLNSLSGSVNAPDSVLITIEGGFNWKL